MSLDTRSFGLTVRYSEGQIREQLADCQRRGWALVIEHTADASAHNRLWDRWGVPIHDPDDPETVMHEIATCCDRYPEHYVRVNACEAGRGQATIRHSLLVHSPEGSSTAPE